MAKYKPYDLTPEHDALPNSRLQTDEPFGLAE